MRACTYKINVLKYFNWINYFNTAPKWQRYQSSSSGFPSRKSDKRQLQQKRSCICVWKSPNRANETVDKTKAGTTNSYLICSAKRPNPISVNNTCGRTIYVDRQHYPPSVAADYRQITSICSKRLAKILELKTTGEWNYVGTSENPADAGTRGFSTHALPKNHWLKRSDFLKTGDGFFQPSTETLQKIKKNKSKMDQVQSSLAHRIKFRVSEV